MARTAQSSSAQSTRSSRAPASTFTAGDPSAVRYQIPASHRKLKGRLNISSSRGAYGRSEFTQVLSWQCTVPGLTDIHIPPIVVCHLPNIQRMVITPVENDPASLMLVPPFRGAHAQAIETELLETRIRQEISMPTSIGILPPHAYTVFEYPSLNNPTASSRDPLTPSKTHIHWSQIEVIKTVDADGYDPDHGTITDAAEVLIHPASEYSQRGSQQYSLQGTNWEAYEIVSELPIIRGRQVASPIWIDQSAGPDETIVDMWLWSTAPSS